MFLQQLNTCIYLCVHSRMLTNIINGSIKKSYLIQCQSEQVYPRATPSLDWASEVRSGMTRLKFPTLTVELDQKCRNVRSELRSQDMILSAGQRREDSRGRNIRIHSKVL